ncbi:hypothetical protein PFICI_10398 [Pestalotiopsis fici W106-1]|uniref:Transcription factor domain-containing protein n=1 Tax=Pestalotiopsis fici (strain W106-1 / CGMCC3.15140) TaxID=1229662 RepID=W3WZM3_PESFW|nr:uncharacterized protein PFICI_10398 [Pestalotiopsis fici W106-1]ETS78336.1 hypothetical protein PFICI_10398 [Pestalotiopsis fici W106-1]
MRFSCEWPGPAGITRRRDAAKSSQKTVYKANQSVPLRPALDRRVFSHAKGDDGAHTEFQKACIQQHHGYNEVLRPGVYPRVFSLPSPPGMACANSIILTPYDRVCLDYFPATTVYSIHSTGAWSPLNQVHRDTAASSSMVMHMLLAHAASDMTRRNPDSHVKLPQLQSGLYHYTAAIQELHNCINPKRTAPSTQGLDAVITTLFLMIHYGLRSGSSLLQARTHFVGLKSLLASWLQSIYPTDREGTSANQQLSALSSQLLIWLLYSDVGGTCSGAIAELVNVLTESSLLPLDRTQLYRNAQIGFPRTEKKLGPVEHMIYARTHEKVFELGHELQLMRSRIWRLPSNASSETRQALYLELLDQCQSIEKRCDDVFRSMYEDDTRRVISKHAVRLNMTIAMQYWTCILFFRRWLVPERAPQPIHRLAVARIVACLHDQYGHDRRRLIRCAWPLFMASIETTGDLSKRRWLLDRLGETRHATAECAWSWEAAQKITALQDSGTRGESVDLRQFMPMLSTEESLGGMKPF